MKKINCTRLIVILGSVLLFSGCGTVTHITSNPSGATITLDGRYAGTTPSSVKVPEYWDAHSKYSFTATKEGYHPQTIICEEVNFLDGAKQAVPGHIHFDLVPIKGTEDKDIKQPGK